ncbi:MAG TPA: DUF308 domain-containing protein [Gemmatimonadaceae bacterium]|nr:DUF308 domain-containing protein [Gemmatimonadaceae bacterium]
MFRPSVELSRAAGTAQLRGSALVLLGCVAIRWPQETLFFSILAAGAIAGTLGIFEIAGALAGASLWSSRAFYLGEGLAFVGFGALTATVPATTPPVAARLTAAWLLVYAVYAALLAARVWYLAPARRFLIAWALVNIAVGVAVRRLAQQPLDALLYWGAFYTAILGLVELVAGSWINRRFVLPTRRAAVAARAGSPRAAARWSKS